MRYKETIICHIHQCTHTPHHHYKFLNSEGHELPMAIVRPEFTRRKAPPGLEGLPLERRDAMDRFVRTAIPHMKRKLLPEAVILVHFIDSSPAPVSFNTVIEAPPNNNASMVMSSAVSSYRSKDTPKVSQQCTVGASGETTQVYDGRLYVQTKNRHSILGVFGLHRNLFE